MLEVWVWCGYMGNMRLVREAHGEYAFRRKTTIEGSV